MRVVLCAVLLGAAAATSSAQVRVVTALPDAAVVTVERHLRERLPDIEVRVRRGSTAELWFDAMRGGPVGADLIVGVDVQVLELFAVGGALASLQVAQPEGAAPFHVDPLGKYVVPWADACVIAWDRRFPVGGGEVPRTLEAMAEPRYADRLVIPAPEAAPSLFVEWIRSRLRDGEPAERVFGLLGSVDARVRRWCESSEAAVSELVTDPECTFAVAPLSAVFALGGTLGFETLEPFGPLLGLGLAVTAQASDPEAARAVAGALLEPSLAVSLAVDHGLLPGLSGALPESAAIPRLVRELVGQSAPVEPDRDLVLGWFRRFDSDVRGHGRYSERLGLVLDVTFLVLFLGAMVWVYRRSQVADS